MPHIRKRERDTQKDIFSGRRAKIRGERFLLLLLEMLGFTRLSA